MLQHQYATMGGEKRGDGKHRSYYTYALSGGSKMEGHPLDRTSRICRLMAVRGQRSTDICR